MIISGLLGFSAGTMLGIVFDMRRNKLCWQTASARCLFVRPFLRHKLHISYRQFEEVDRIRQVLNHHKLIARCYFLSDEHVDTALLENSILTENGILTNYSSTVHIQFLRARDAVWFRLLWPECAN